MTYKGAEKEVKTNRKDLSAMWFFSNLYAVLAGPEADGVINFTISCISGPHAFIRQIREFAELPSIVERTHYGPNKNNQLEY